jgi:hypothetical protein
MHWTNLERDLPKVGVRPLDYLSIPILGRHITSTARLPIAPSAPQRLPRPRRVCEWKAALLRASTSLSRSVIGRPAWVDSSSTSFTAMPRSTMAD